MSCPAPQKIHITSKSSICSAMFPTRGGKNKIPKTGKAEKQEGNLEHNHNGTAWNAGPSIPACSLLILVSAPPAPALFPCLIPSPFACPMFLPTPCLLPTSSSPHFPVLPSARSIPAPSPARARPKTGTTSGVLHFQEDPRAGEQCQFPRRQGRFTENKKK